MSDKRSDKVFIFAGRATQDLARRVAEIYGIPLGNSTVFQYADGEFQPSYEETIRGGIVFIIQSTIPPTDNLFELLMMIDAAKRASAQKIIAVIPYYGFARQDRKDRPHVPIASKLIADMISVAGVDRVITMDLHADQIQGFFNIPVDHLYGSSLFMPYIREKFDIEDVMFASPDMGGSKRAGTYAKTLNNSFVICYKHRNKPNEIGEMRLIGDVEGKHVILLDDIENTKKQALADFKEKAKPYEEMRKEAISNLRTKSEVVTEECFKVLDEETKTIGFYNANGDLVSSRPAFQIELQRKLNIFTELKTGTHDL